MPTPHKHAEIIKAWADGHTIQVQVKENQWERLTTTPSWCDKLTYRVEPKPQIVECFVDILQGRIVFTPAFVRNARYKKATLTIHPDE